MDCEVLISDRRSVDLTSHADLERIRFGSLMVSMPIYAPRVLWTSRRQTKESLSSSELRSQPGARRHGKQHRIAGAESHGSGGRADQPIRPWLCYLQFPASAEDQRAPPGQGNRVHSKRSRQALLPAHLKNLVGPTPGKGRLRRWRSAFSLRHAQCIVREPSG